MAEMVHVSGVLIAETAARDHSSSPSISHGGRLLLFRTSVDWTLLELRHRTTWDEAGRPDGGSGSVQVTTYGNLASVKAHLEAFESESWTALVHAGWNDDPELRQLWVPVQIDLDLKVSSVDRRELGVREGARDVDGWQGVALGLAAERLQEIGFIVIRASREMKPIFGHSLAWPWNQVVGALAIVKYGYRADVVVAIDGFGEIHVRTPDSVFSPGAPRRHPPRPLTRRESRQADALYRDLRANGEGR